jgi:glycosyltransferase involved in cell wall biosynthesis
MPLLVCVGSLEDYKGHTYLIDAMALLKARGVACRLLCAGSGPLREELREQVRRVGLAGRVRFLGPATPDQVRRLLGAASAVVLASVQTRSGKMEGIPVALMEAMAMERPVVATRLSGVPELVDEGVTGLLVPQRNPMALAGAVALILKDRELAARLGCNARAKVLKDYSLHANVSQLLALMHPFLAPHAVSLASTADMKARRRELLHPAAAEQGRNEVQRR